MELVSLVCPRFLRLASSRRIMLRPRRRLFRGPGSCSASSNLGPLQTHRLVAAGRLPSTIWHLFCHLMNPSRMALNLCQRYSTYCRLMTSIPQLLSPLHQLRRQLQLRPNMHLLPQLRFRTVTRLPLTKPKRVTHLHSPRQLHLSRLRDRRTMMRSPSFQQCSRPILTHPRNNNNRPMHLSTPRLPRTETMPTAFRLTQVPEETREISTCLPPRQRKIQRLSTRTMQPRATMPSPRQPLLRTRCSRVPSRLRPTPPRSTNLRRSPPPTTASMEG
mmetsp:Transcript_16163/g.29154  ORF Transcript_16163/g.29154 Transcript_16163/m.29154 type:complete len:274 (+) Transcript_16163:651-1472(+)